MAKPLEAAAPERPYPASLIDRLNDWFSSRDRGAWLPYALLGATLVAVQLAALWLAGNGQGQELLPVLVFNGLFTPFLLAWMALLDRQAVAALDNLRALLPGDEAVFAGLRYRLAHMPFPWALAAGALMLALAILMEQLWVTPQSYAALQELPGFAVLFQVVDKSSAFLFGVFLLHTVRQLRLVNTIHNHYLDVQLFNLGPARAFSRLTATTALGLVVGVYGWLLINPELLDDPGILAVGAAITLLAAAVFLWPLYGLQRRMAAAKAQALQQIEARYEAQFDRFNQYLAREDYAAIEKQNAILMGLEIQQRKISSISTWPWRPETGRFALSAIVLPLVLMVLGWGIERWLGW